MKRLLPLVTTTVLCGALAFVAARDPGAAREKATEFDADRQDAVLERKVAELRLESTPFAQAVETLARAANANIVVKWPAVEAQGVNPEDKIRLSVREVPLHTALTILLETATQKPGRLDYCTTDGVIIVSAADDVGLCPVTRVYDVRDLVRAQIQWHRHAMPATRPVRVVVGSFSSQWYQDDANLTENEAAQAVVDLIESTVAPDTWRDNGGNAVIRSVAGLLVITQTPALHRRVDRLLGALRQALNAAPSTQAAIQR